jgi:hypothetical protein
MNNVKLTDLDELALTVRDKTSRSYIGEAISAYRGGAYRAAIMSAWIAVTSDIIAKARELAGQGDANAMALIAQLENAIGNNNIPQLQKIENELLDRARNDFEFLSSHEYTDLDRLKQDRNLCAHPAFVAEEALFQPTPELVRSHVVHAVVHLLQHQPVQGKSALARIRVDITRPSFPTDLDSVIEFLNTKYLNYAKDALVRNLVVGLLKGYLRGDEPDLIGREQALLHSLVAVSRRYPVIYDEVMSGKLAETAGALDDNQLARIFRLLGADERSWQWLGEPTRIRVRSMLSGFSHKEMVNNNVFDAMNVAEFKPLLIDKLNGLSVEDKEQVIAEAPRPEFADIAVDLYSGAGSFRRAESLGTNVLLPMSPFFAEGHVIKILEAAKINDQIRWASGSPDIFSRFFDDTRRHLNGTKEAWREFIATLREDPDSHYYYPDLRQKLIAHGVLPASGDGS